MSMPLQAILASMAARIRHPDAPLPAGLPAERMDLVSQLVAATLRGLLDRGFPVLRARLGDAAWECLVRQYGQAHPAQEPLFPRIGEEFVRWLASSCGDRGALPLPPWAIELAHYERVETSLFFHPDPPDWRGWSPLAWPLAYAWPVHRLAASEPPDRVPDTPTWLLAWRNADDDVRFDVLSRPAWQLASALADGGTPDTCITRIAGETSVEIDTGRRLVDHWREAGLWRD